MTKIETSPREISCYHLLGLFRIPYGGPLMESYQDGDSKQRKMVLETWRRIFNFNMTKPTVTIQEAEGVVDIFENYLFRQPFTTHLVPEARSSLALLITQSLQEKYLPSEEEQFQLVKRLKDALVSGGGHDQHFDFCSAGKSVLDAIVDSFGLREYIEQFPESTPLAYRGMTETLKQLANINQR